ncbi:MAG: DUF192 domain-containing protein [Fimbriimonadaceae bacterium]
MKGLLLASLVIALFGCGSESGRKAATPDPQLAAKPSSQRMYDLKDFETVNLELNGNTIKAWVADNTFKITEGMMWLSDDEVKPDEAMLFVMPAAAPQSFWMRNTLIPLDLVFLSEQGRVLNVVQGKPLDEATKLRSKGAAMYVIELKQGTAKRMGVSPGQVVEIPSVIGFKG